MSLLNKVWRVMQKLGKQPRRLPPKAQLELIHCLGAMPLLSCYLRSLLPFRLPVHCPRDGPGSYLGVGCGQVDGLRPRFSQNLRWKPCKKSLQDHSFNELHVLHKAEINMDSMSTAHGCALLVGCPFEAFPAVTPFALAGADKLFNCATLLVAMCKFYTLSCTCGEAASTPHRKPLSDVV
eukprot:2765072-Amphidinium_carterae.1